MEKTLDKIITEKLERLASDPVIWWQKTWWSRGALLELIAACESGLRRGGFRAGQSLALLLPNSPVFIALAAAVWRLGGVIVPVDYRSGYVSMIKQLKHANVFGAVTYRGKSDIAPLISEEGIPCVITGLDSPPEQIPGRSTEPDGGGLAVIFYTSGTTGEPKAVPITHKNLIANIEACMAHIHELTEDDVFLNALPNYNSFGFVTAALLPLAAGIRQVILTSFMPPDAAMTTMKDAQVTIVPAVPTMISLLFGAAARGFLPSRNLRYIISGGDSLPPGFYERSVRELGVPLLEGYGLTEATAVVAMTPGEKGRKSDSVGTLLANIEAEIRGDDGEVLPAGSEGGLWLRGPSVATSYYRDEALTAERFSGGWFNTNDIACFDEDGYLYLVSRASDMIFVGGFKVYALEVERVLMEHPAVAQVAVVGVPRSISGEIVKAFVVLKKGEKATPKELIQFSRKKLSYYKVPRIVEFLSEMPRSDIGEILKRKLVENY